jgi:hypothetical protein
MRDPSPYAGKTVTLRADIQNIGGLPAEVADWYERLHDGIGWRDRIAVDPRCESYNMRSAMAGLPDDNDVLYARVDGMGMLIHVTEIQGYVSPPTPPAALDPSPVSESEIGVPCPACQVPLAQGDMVAVLILGPGADPAARAACLAGQDYQGVAVELHWACRTGDTSYESEA